MKPTDRQHAKQMLGQLSGRTHQVITGVTVLNLKGRTISFSEVVDIQFKKLRSQEIETYLDTDEPYDKAGAYGLQGKVFVEHYTGDLEAAMGLPTTRLKEVLNS